MTRQYRHEIKYLIDKNMAEILKQRLSMIMSVDANGKEGYFIRSLYFDTINSKAYYDKIDGIEFRKKYRIRIYNKDNKYIRLEKKIKDNYMTAKEQTLLTKKKCTELLSNKLKYNFVKDELLKEFLIEIKTKNLIPSVIVDYDRYALVYPVSDVRITFDSNIRTGLYNYNIYNYDNPSFETLDSNLIVLEVKYNEVLPLIIANILETVPIDRTGFSKFAICRSIK